MAESKAAESYNRFENIRNRFGGAKKATESRVHQLAASKTKSKRRFDPRTNAPPLVALVEESDQIQEELSSSHARLANLSWGVSSPVKGKWKHSHLIKSNHLTPEFDALETSSEASYSSAYSSHCSDIQSPTVGSVSELSDVSNESFLEYDMKRMPIPLSRTAVLKATFERSLPNVKRNDTAAPEILVSPEIVPTYTKAWNEIIGDWTFEGIPSPPHSISEETWRPSKEVRCMTPSATPTHGSTNDLLGGGSRASLLNGLSNCDGSESEEGETNWGLAVKYKLDAFAHDQRKSSIASGCHKHKVPDLHVSQTDKEEPANKERDNTTKEPNSSGKVEPESDKKLLDMTWSQANQKYNKIIVLKQRRQKEVTSTATYPPEEQLKQGEQEMTEAEPSSLSIVEQRAKLFGGLRIPKHTKSALLHKESSCTSR